MAKGSYLGKLIAKDANLLDRREKISAEPLTPEQREIFEDGKVILIDKPLHWTSFDVVKKIRGMIRVKKTGHAGTLDPLATGLLILCTGKFTKRINEYMAAEKEYTGTIMLGAVTPTYDLESAPEQFRRTEAIGTKEIEVVADQFTGKQMQMPPVYSAIKKNGVAAYELARRSKGAELEPRPIVISLLELDSSALPELSFRVRCSTGTYIRSLAHDIGRALGCGAYLASLRRTAIGEFRVENAHSIKSFAETLGTKTDS